MRRFITLFLVYTMLFLPIENFAQLGQSNLPPASQKGDSCQPSKVHVKIKLKNGDTITGDSLEINQREVKLCHEGRVQAIPGENIKEIKSRQTAVQRFRHAARVVGITFAAIIAFGLIRAAQER